MLTSSGRCLRASVVVISWTSYGNGTALSLMLLLYVTYVASTALGAPGPGLTLTCVRAVHDGCPRAVAREVVLPSQHARRVVAGAVFGRALRSQSVHGAC